MKIDKYTLVQHSGYYTGHLEFRHAVESQSVITKTEENLVRRAGGVLFNTWEEANEAEQNVNYPPGHPEGLEGLIPNAQGTFSEHAIQGQAIYLPATVTVT